MSSQNENGQDSSGEHHRQGVGRLMGPLDLFKECGLPSTKNFTRKYLSVCGRSSCL